jgi:ribosomal protein S18 acetylase RimI-like enzyme
LLNAMKTNEQQESTTTTTTTDGNSHSNNKNNYNGNSKPRFVIEKIGYHRNGGRGRNSSSSPSSSSHASYFYGEYVPNKVYREISDLCLQTLLGVRADQEETQLQSILFSTQKMEFYQSFQPEELRRRKDDVKMTCEFFVAYALTEATSHDVEEYVREQQIQQQVWDSNDQHHHDNNKNYNTGHTSDNYYYRVDPSIQSPTKMMMMTRTTNGYDPYKNSNHRRRNKNSDDDVVGISPSVVMGGTLGGNRGVATGSAAGHRSIQARRHQQRQANASRTQQRYRQIHNSQMPRTKQAHERTANVGDGGDYGTGGHDWDALSHRHEGAGEFYNGEGDYPLIEQPFVVGGNLGDVGPVTKRQQQQRRRVMTGRGATTGPLFAHKRRYHQDQPDLGYFKPPSSTQLRSSQSNFEGKHWRIEQPFMVDHGHDYTIETKRRRRRQQQHQQQQRNSWHQPAHHWRHQAARMPHETTHLSSHHTYSSDDGGMNFHYHYIPTSNQQPSTVHDEDLPEISCIDEQQPHTGTIPLQNTTPNRGHVDNSHYTFPSSFSADGAVHDKGDAATTMWVKGNIVGFVEIVYTPYSLGDLDDPDMQMAGMKPHRPVLRNLMVAEHARNSGIGTRLLEACERHVQTHWQMKELVVEVDDLQSDSTNQGEEQDQQLVCEDTPLRSSAVEFFRRKGYDVVLSDPESTRYDEVTGQITGQIQCRRDVMRKVLDGLDETGVNKPDKAARVTQTEGTSNSKPTCPTGEWLSTAVDVEYTATETESGANFGSKTRTREDINDPNPTTAELLTDLEEGPRRRSSQRSTVTCDPEGPNQSIFRNSRESHI